MSSPSNVILNRVIAGLGCIRWEAFQRVGSPTRSIRSLVFWALQWRHIGRDSLSNHQPHDCLLNRLFRRRSKKTSKLHVTSLCARNSPVTGEFPAQMASNAENVSIWWRHHETLIATGGFIGQTWGQHGTNKWPTSIWGRLNIKMPPYQHGNFLYKDKTVTRPSYLYDGNPYTRKDAFCIETRLRWTSGFRHNAVRGASPPGKAPVDWPHEPRYEF